MLLGRALAYNGAQRNRIGTNFQQLPVNRPKVAVNTYMFDGQMTYYHSGNAPVYVPIAAAGPGRTRRVRSPMDGRRMARCCVTPIGCDRMTMTHAAGHLGE